MAFARALFSFASSSSSSHYWTVFILLSVMSLSMLPVAFGRCVCSPCNYLLNGDERCKCCVYHLMGKRSGDPTALKFWVNEEPVSVRKENFSEFDDTILPRLDKLYLGIAASETLPTLFSRDAELGFDKKVSIGNKHIPSNLLPKDVIQAKHIMESVKSVLSDPAFARDSTAVKNLQTNPGRNVEQFLQAARNTFLGLELNRRRHARYPLNQIPLW